jgi:Nucleotidyl transferase AbiEii toxin, Type IV TA system
MLSEREELEKTLLRICQRLGLNAKRAPSEHAGGKWRLAYASAVQFNGTLEIDISYLYRTALWPIDLKNSCKIGPYQATQIPVLDIHELAAGKLTALMSRHASRDLYDAHQLTGIFKKQGMNQDQLRLAFIVFGGMSRQDWRQLNIHHIDFDHRELANNLIPVLNQNNLQPNTNQLIMDAKQCLSYVFPFSDAEEAFLNNLLIQGEIQPSLITNNLELQEKIMSHPGLLWKIKNVKKFKLQQ